MASGNGSAVGKILRYQLVLILLVAAGFAVKDEQLGLSAALGGMAAFLPNLYFAFWTQRSAGKDIRKVVNSFYVGESGKFFLTVLIFIAIFQLPNIHILPLLVGYITALSVFWFALLMR
jgi:ATP synthase protein I